MLEKGMIVEFVVVNGDLNEAVNGVIAEIVKANPMHNGTQFIDTKLVKGNKSWGHQINPVGTVHMGNVKILNRTNRTFVSLLKK
jgi:hypothetical protein